MMFPFPVSVRSSNELAGREGCKQRVCAEAVGLQHGVRTRCLHQPAGDCLQVHHRQAVDLSHHVGILDCTALPVLHQKSI